MDNEVPVRLQKWRDMAITLCTLAATTALCVVLRGLSEGETYVPLLFVLCVLVVSRLTDGYIWGIATAVVAVLGVNYVFTYPYMAFDFTISGYPVTFVVMLAVSITTSTLTTQTKQRERLKLETAREQMRANLLRAVSHDLRTPLTTISGSVRAVLDDPELPEDKKRELLGGVRDDADWLLRMVENLLSVTRMDGGASIVKSEEAAEEICAAAATKFHKRFPELELSVSVPEEVLFIPMDPVLIEQVLTNLLENAAVHGGPGVRHISLSVERQEGAAAFTVSDDGAGISRDRVARLFTDYFDQAQESAGKGEKRNMGIGLSVCKSIVTAHGGEVSAENPPGGGARFRFTLPLS